MEINKYLPDLDSIYHTELNTTKSFMEIAQSVCHIPGTVILLSGSDLDCAKYNIIATHPIVEIITRENCTLIKKINTEEVLYGSPLKLLNSILKYLHIKKPISYLPITWGLFGYISYDLKDQIEKLPKTCLDDIGLPHLHFIIPRFLIIEDRGKKKKHLITAVLKEDTHKKIKEEISKFHQTLLGPPCSLSPFIPTGEMRSNFSQKRYIEAIEKIKDYIVKGDVYQVNLSQRFEIDYRGCEFHLFKKLFELNPAPFFAYINAHNYKILSTSPERFLYQRGEYIETRPIKGTRPRGKTEKEDQLMKRELMDSKKDDAELSMIVDLLRNDIGKICRPGSVKVKEHKRIEKYENVYHLVSIITGRLKQGILAGDIIEATFPGGSITGCPKIRAMEIIDEIEPHTRGVYTGSIGYISFHHTLDLSIAIRTAVAYQNRLTLSVGGGIVFDSDPSLEYEETLHKGKSFIKLIKTSSSSNSQKTYQENSPPYIWQNGHFISEDKACASVLSPTLQYGMGIFETIMGKKNKIFFMEDHISRMKKAWKEIFNIPLPKFYLPSIVENLIKLNKLEQDNISIKIMAGIQKDQRPFIVIVCKRYIPRTLQPHHRGLHLEIYPYPRLTPLADHKTMNYLYYYRAGMWARKKGADEALILNPDGSISEGNSSNIILIRGEKIILPISVHVLRGIMEKKAVDFLKKKNYKVKYRVIFPHDISTEDVVLVTNSLIGVMAVERIGDIKISNDAIQIAQRISREINKNLLE